MRRSLSRLLAGVLIAAAGLANAQNWPTHPVRLIVSLPPGSGPDVIARLFAERLSRSWGQQAFVENRAGGQNVIGAQAAARAPADGYTFFLAPAAALAINVYTIKPLSYDPERDFVPVALLAKSPFVLVVNSGVSARSVAELVALAKSQPDKLFFASDGQTNVAGMMGEMLKAIAGVRIVQVPYGGPVQALQDTITGRTHMTFQSSPTIAPFIGRGELRALAVTGAQRIPGMESIPTLKETYPEFEYLGWYMLVAPAGTPIELVQKVNGDITEVLRDQEVGQKLLNFGAIPEKNAGTPASLKDFLRTELERWGKAVRTSGVEAK